MRSMVKLGELEPFQDHIDRNTISTMKPKKNECNGYDFLRVCMKNAKIKIHKDLPATDMWTYEGHTQDRQLKFIENKKW